MRTVYRHSPVLKNFVDHKAAPWYTQIHRLSEVVVSCPNILIVGRRGNAAFGSGTRWRPGWQIRVERR
jgi:hypothetical protein